ncbi:putative F-box and JmjC domain protein [Tothia fuscella]|uniref:F-box and JmjC domain protein n=1 Tax=Tothia fuscella TaxID=1048955 RepID=A0A9P4U485_9PEZI|nr:putative F-box and JmjC domain protein [Tothia fuscella]
MAPGILLSTVEEDDSRPLKRTKLSTGDSDAVEVASPHPLGVKPLGNAYTASSNSKANTGLFSRLPDELLAHFLELLNTEALRGLGSSCKALFAFTRADDLWRALFIESPPKDFKWLGTWRRTYLQLSSDHEARIICKNLFSDVLYRPFYCANTPLNIYASNIPSQNKIPRLPNMTSEEFSDQWSYQPFILTSPVKEWPIYSKWTTESLLRDYCNIPFRAEAVDWPLKTYTTYMYNNQDESPLYLFDRNFVSKMNLEVGKDNAGAAYWPAECFGEDLFSVLGDQRPDSSWLIMGPARSGSTFHKDPNATSAWNAPLTGSKYWLMFPSSASLPPPPGVILSEDGSEITSPLSIAEYMLSFHELARATPGCKEGICYAGEVLHVPSGWFHLVLNLEESIALTQNFVPRKKLSEVLRFLRDCPDQISGFKDDVKDPYGLFVERLGRSHPEVLEEGLKELERKDKQGGRGKWEELTKPKEEEEHGFSFGFGDDDDNADIP